MTENELKIIKNHLMYGKMTVAVNSAIKNCLSENEKLKEENSMLLREQKQLLNRCKAMTKGGLCMFCGFKERCYEHDGE